MTSNNSQKILLHNQTNTFTEAIAKVYVFCLAFKMIAPMRFLESIVGSVALSFDVIPHAIGILLVLIDNNGFITFADEEGKTISFFFKMVFWFTLSSILMAIVIQNSYGNMGGESAYTGIMGMIIYWFQYAFILLYNYHVFKILNIRLIEKTLNAIVLFLMIIGYMQMAVMLLGNQIGYLYDKLDIFDILNDSNDLSKLPLTGPEGAYAGYIIGTLILPYIYARNLGSKTRKHTFLYILLWLPIIYMTFSSGAYILFFITTIGYIYYCVKTRGFSKNIAILLVVALFGSVIFVLFRDEIINALPEDMGVTIKYLLFEKIQDNDNGSTVLRSIPFYYNWGAFKEYPIIGVGNGLQGYFLEKYLPHSLSVVKGVNASKLIKQWTTGIANGSIFWPSIMSGYGIVGIILFAIYIYKNERLVRTKTVELDFMYYMYRLGILGIIFTGFATEFVAKYYVWFTISIPLMTVSKQDNLASVSNRDNNINHKYFR